MKRLQIALLVLAGALAGALVMTVWQHPGPAPAESPVAAPVQPVSTTVPPPAPAPTGQVAELPSPFVPPEPLPPEPTRRKLPSITMRAVNPPAPSHPRTRQLLSDEKPQDLPRPKPQAQPQTAPTPDPDPIQKPAQLPTPLPQSSTTPSSAPPARTEPENVTPATPQASPQTPPPALPPAEPQPEPHRVTLNAGMLIPVRLVDGLSSERNAPGDTFVATLYREIVADGFVIAERGARVEGRVVWATKGDNGRGNALLSVTLTRLTTSDGQDVRIQTDNFDRRADSMANTNAAKIGGGAALGAIIGGIAGGGKGAAVGAGVGGGAGAGDVLLTKGKAVALPSETRITFRLGQTITLTEKRSD